MAAYPRFAIQAPLQFKREQEVRQLGFPVGIPLVVSTILEIQIIHIKAARPSMRQARDIDHARARGFLQRIHQQSGEREMTQVIGPYLHLEAIFSTAKRYGHDARIVDEQI